MNIYLKDFEHFAENDDMTLPLLMALGACENGDTICLGGGVINLYPKYAFSKEYYISNNDYGLKPIAMPIIDMKNFTVDGEGATLMFHGCILPFVVDESENITLKNFTVDYAEARYFAAKITAAQEDFVEMEFDDSKYHCDLKDGKFVFYGKDWENVRERVLVNEFDPAYKGPTPYTATYSPYTGTAEDKTFMSGFVRYLKGSKPAENRIRLEGPIGYKHIPGNYWLCTHNSRQFPGIFVTESKDICIENILLTHTLSMGVICQLTENITLESVRALPREDRLLSVNADATHFVNCTGEIHFNNCVFESMMDDAANFHGIYLPVKRKMGDRSVLLYFGHPQQRGINIFKKGDKIRLLDNKTLMHYAEFTVENSRLISGDFLLLTTVENLPKEIPMGHVFENHSRMPSVHVENCRCGNNRPRGFLISTCKKALVENCTFYNMSYAIDMAGDANSWYESGACREVIIRNNNFENAAYAGGPVIMADPQIQALSGKPYHNNIVIENNVFTLHEPRFMQLLSCGNVMFKGNKYIQDDALPSHRTTGENGFLLRECENVEIEEI